MKRLTGQLSFIHEMDKLKYIFRKTRLFNSPRHENDAEHSWHLALMAIVLAEHANRAVDLLKVVTMLLIHDLVEIDAGDVFLYDGKTNSSQIAAERKAAERIFGLLPEAQGASLLALWDEFEKGETAEARFARSMDRLEPLLQNVSNAGGTWMEYGVGLEQVLEKKEVIRYGSETLWRFARKLINESVEKGILKPKDGVSGQGRV